MLFGSACSAALSLAGALDEGYEEPWFVVTDLPVEEAQACWYGLRPWIECGFKDGKRGGGTGNAVGVRSLHGWNGSGWPWR
ncbi:hypothetical protein KDK_51730 [Dictyobacter kobayashii]|uniref:Uncharacterized protein n=1 Tax=Dictyobacter kobayashii TaxID=2014872 RepID=A0A402AQD6_9CHLR|nr:hypothetical protein KDK_51730 [Dictyobacter kobayashii]